MVVLNERVHLWSFYWIELEFGMKKVGIGLTVVLALGTLMSGGATLVGAKPVADTFVRLHIPSHLLLFLGAAKIAAGLGLLVLLWKPGWVRLREWVFAGLVFNFAGAFWWHLSGGDSLAQSMPPMMMLVFALVVYGVGRKLEGEKDVAS